MSEVLFENSATDRYADDTIALFDAAQPDTTWLDTPWPPEVRACALPQLRYTLFLGLGGAVIAIALGIAALRKLRSW